MAPKGQRAARSALSPLIGNKENVESSPIAKVAETKVPAKKSAAVKKATAAAADMEALIAQLEAVKIENESKESMIKEQMRKLEEKEAILAAKEEEFNKLQQKMSKIKKSKAFVPEIDVSELLESSESKKVDPRKPKQPLSAYMLWCNHNRASVAEENPNANLGEISKILSEKWKVISDEERKPFLDQHALEMEVYTPLRKEYEELLKKEKEEKKLIDKIHNEKKMDIAAKLLDQYLTELQEAENSKKKTRDPNKPKAPLSAFFVFVRQRRAEMGQQGSPAKGSPRKVTAVSKLLGEEWSALSSNEKAPFEKVAQEERSKYEKDMELYNQQKAEAEGIAEAERKAKYDLELKTALEVKAKEDKGKAELQKLKQLAEERKIEIRNEKKEAVNEKKEIRKEKKAAKDAAPKRPPTGYNLFVRETLPELKSANGSLTPAELKTLAATTWKAMDKESQKVWKDKAAPAFKEYKAELANYEASHPEQGPELADVGSATESVGNVSDVSSK